MISPHTRQEACPTCGSDDRQLSWCVNCSEPPTRCTCNFVECPNIPWHTQQPQTPPVPTDPKAVYHLTQALIEKDISLELMQAAFEEVSNCTLSALVPAEPRSAEQDWPKMNCIEFSTPKDAQLAKKLADEIQESWRRKNATLREQLAAVQHQLDVSCEAVKAGLERRLAAEAALLSAQKEIEQLREAMQDAIRLDKDGDIAEGLIDALAHLEEK